MSASDFESIWSDAVVVDHEDATDYDADVSPQSSQTLDQIRTLLNPTKYDGDGSEYQTHLKARLSGTGNWLFDSTAYKQWHQGHEHGILWIRGIPGSGKSVFASNLIHEFAKEDSTVLHFFFRHTFDANHTPEAALRDWLAQILEESPHLQLELKKSIDQPEPTGSHSIAHFTFHQLCVHLRIALMHSSKRVYFVVDALDEMNQDRLKEFLQAIDALGQWRPSQFKVILTGRPVPLVEKTLRGLQILDIRLDKNMVEGDIVEYVRYRLSLMPWISAASHSDVQDTIVNRAGGLFLYAKLALDTLSQSKGDVRTLQDAPVDLNLMYTRLLNEHIRRVEAPRSLQVLILQCVTYSIRPLRLLEIADLINVTQPQEGCDLGQIKDLVRAICGPLIEILPDETVRIVHHSLTEYLNGTTRRADQNDYPVFEYGPSHNHMALTCLSYLGAGCLDRIQLENVHHGSTMAPKWQLVKDQILPPLTQYAVSNWHVHVKKAIAAGQVQAEVNRALEKLLISENMEKLQHLYPIPIITPWWVMRDDRKRTPVPLHYAIVFDLRDFACEILQKDASTAMKVSSPDKSLIHCAAGAGSGEMVKLLLSHGADLREFDEDLESPLQTAVENHRIATAKVLLEATDLDPFSKEYPKHFRNVCGSVGESVFAGRDLDMAGIFLESLKSSEGLCQALHCSIGSQPRHFIERILRHPKTDVNYKVFNVTPLYQACVRRDIDSIEMLLEAGANPQILHFQKGDDLGSNVFHPLVSVSPWRENQRWMQRQLTDDELRKCFRLLLDAGADPNQKDAQGYLPILCAADVVAVRCLLELGADPNAANKFGETLLHNSKNPAILELLLPRADVNLRQSCDLGRVGRTPLQSVLATTFMSKERQIEVALSLLEHGADAAAVDAAGESVLHYAMTLKKYGEFRLPLLRKLCTLGVDLNVRNDHHGQTPLHKNGPGFRGNDIWTLDDGEFDAGAMQTLVTAGANTEIKDNRGQTPLFQSMSCRTRLSIQDRKEICEKYIQAGARLDTVDSKGRTLMHAVMFYTFDDSFLKFLVDKGLDPNQTDNQGNNLFHEVMPFWAKHNPTRHTQLYDSICDLCDGWNQPNHLGQTPLHILSSFRPTAFDPYNSSYTGGRPSNCDKPAAFDYFLERYENVNMADANGFTPLHITSTFSEYLTRKLLAKGADISMATKEGLTVFHLAARSRQENILGLLLEHFVHVARQDELFKVLNSKDVLNRTALYYACASGRIASVKMLINAGATTASESYVGSVWNGCSDFEMEQSEGDWSRITGLDSRDYYFRGIPECGGVTISDRTRPQRSYTRHAHKIPFPIERLDEIIESLATCSSDFLVSFLDEAIDSAGDRGFDYTVDCLLRLRNKIGAQNDHQPNDTAKECLERRTEFRSSFVLATDEEERYAQFVTLMNQRQYAVVSEYGNELAHLNSRGFHRRPLHHLAAGGFTSLVDGMVTAEWLEQNERNDETNEFYDPQTWVQPLLTIACQQDVPNMDIVRMLVEKKKSNVNVRMTSQGRAGKKISDGPAGLHYLATSDHWWKAAEGIPYLISHGADPDAQDHYGLTPLSAAFEYIKGPCFDRQAVRTLLELGADPNAHFDDILQKGDLLKRAIDDKDMSELLIRHGARVSSTCLIEVIRRKDFSLLTSMLKLEGDLNEQTSARSPSPFASALCELGRAIGSSESEDTTEDWKMLRLLLSHGANPFAPYQEQTVLHHIMKFSLLGSFSTPAKEMSFRDMLQAPQRNLDVRDSGGRTLFMLTCQAGFGDDDKVASSLRSLMLVLGTDLRARDFKGRTTLHHCFVTDEFVKRSGLYSPVRDIQFIISRAPDLINVTDNELRSPLHYALMQRRGMTGGSYHNGEANALLSAGAEVHLVNAKGATPLHLLFGKIWTINLDDETPILENKEPEILSELLRRGADINARSHGGEQDNPKATEQNPEPSWCRPLDVDELLPKRPKRFFAGDTPLFTFFRHGKIAAKLPNHDPNMNWAECRKIDGALEVEHESVVWDCFDNAGVDWTATNAAGETLLHIVAQDTRNELDQYDYAPGRRVGRFKWLMEKGLDPMREDREHRTPLDLAAALELEDILELFKKED